MQLKALRKRAGLTQDQLAILLGIDRITVWRWEKGISRPRGAMKKRLALALRVDELEGAARAEQAV